MSNADNAARWHAQMRQTFIGRYRGIAASVAAEFADEAQRRMVRRMPVRTGHARANVQVNYFGPALSEIPSVDPAGGSTIAFNSAKIANAQPFQNIHISITIPYGERLEHGWSRQAPEGVVEPTLRELQAEARAIGARGADKAIGRTGGRAA